MPKYYKTTFQAHKKLPAYGPHSLFGVYLKAHLYSSRPFYFHLSLLKSH